MNIEYRKGDLLNTDGLIAHSCNINGSFGAGVALAVAKKYPKVKSYYKELCNDYEADLGEVQFVDTHLSCIVANMFVVDYDLPDPLEQDNILKYTDKCLRVVKHYCELNCIKEINIPKINSGIYKVPWELTEEVIKGIDSYVNVIVWEL